jgi:putative transcription factor
MALIEGARLTVCPDCSKHGKIVIQDEKIDLPSTLKTPIPAMHLHLQPKKAPTASVDTSNELVDDYDVKIRQAREKIGLSHEDLGKKINEKASVLRKMETKKMAPNNSLVAKLEHTLKIKLIAQIADEKLSHKETKTTPSRELTLGDLIKIDDDSGE